VTAVLDASAVLTLLYRETGHEVVAGLVDGARVSSVNWSEVTRKLAQRGVSDPGTVTSGLLALGAEVVSFHRADAEAAAALWPAARARARVLSLGDRACLATAIAAPGGYAVTADTAWAEVDTDVEIRVIRGS